MTADTAKTNRGPVAVIGAGGWGTALACVLAYAGNEVRLWARRPDFASLIQVERQNSTYLPDVALPPNIVATSDPGTAALDIALAVFATPTQALRDVAELFRAHLPGGLPLVSASKGVEVDTLLRPTQILAEVFGRPHVLCISGPNFAAEVARRLPAASVLAAADVRLAGRVREWFAGQNSFRIYTRQDVIGVELGGALKNVIAIVAGIADGLALGLNARAAIITRGLAEITRLGVAMGADPLTFAGLSGIGDLVLTCTGSLSRNQWAGRELGSGRSLDDIVGGTRMVIEGVSTTRAARELARRHAVDMPLTNELHQVLFEGKPPREAVASVLARTLRDEQEHSPAGAAAPPGRKDVIPGAK